MHKKTFTIILPTFNEANNVRPMLYALTKAMRKFEHKYKVLFVDDSSDETPDVIRECIKDHRHVSLLHRPKEKRTGLASAFIDGFRHADTDYIVCMDSDLQHPPEAIPLMAQRAISEASDIVVGSRYIPGGSPEGLGSRYRIWVSRYITRYSSWFLLAPTRRSTDPGAGMFLVRRDLVGNLEFENVRGFKILIDILTRIPWARVSEEPIIFHTRENDQSKATLKQGINFYIHIFHLFIAHRIANIYRGYIGICAAILILGISAVIVGHAETFFQSFIVAFALFLFYQSAFMIYLMMYAWENPDHIKKNKSPEQFLPPKYSFAIFIPARHEEAVIADTIQSVSKLDYPEAMKEVLILINRKDDAETIRITKETIAKLGKKNIRLVDFEGPLGKPIGLNIGLKNTNMDVVTIFDAEDEIHPDILNVVNTAMIQNHADIVQSGVQLMNFNSNWYSLFNVMEYYFWFKSVLHFFANNGMIPLGGNTVFFKKHWLERVGGWDEKNLTEDADIGIRMSAAGARTKVIYDEEHVTREETPPSVAQFIKQRTRWNQGFIQVLFKGVWTKLPKKRQRFLAVYILTWLFFQGMLFVLLPFSVALALFFEMSPLLGLVVNLPFYALGFLYVILNIGLYEFHKSYDIKYSPLLIIKTAVFYFPFQILLGISAFRAIIRQLFGNITWEKTAHTNVNRQEV
ncbi:MAG: hypothetical protein CR972_02285 [Candidatus Moraniibacteriota bacterium]|nr:MAG: hypothetical protein CR972_02285 [Candidatus Moranbacteria bacterium]